MATIEIQFHTRVNEKKRKLIELRELLRAQ